MTFPSLKDISIRISGATLMGFILVLSSCASPTPYRPASDKELGYKSLKIDDQNYRVTFEGNKLTPREKVETYLFFRAAELTLENDYSFFRVTDFTTEKEVDGEIVPTLRSTSMYPYPYYSYGFPWSPTPTRFRTTNEYKAVAYITMYKEKPTGDPAGLFQAEQVIENLKAQIEKPK